MIREEIRDILKIELAPIEQYINYIYMGGSYFFDIIKNKHDYDIIIVCKHSEDMSACRKILDKRILRQNYNLDIHFTTDEYIKTILINSDMSYFCLKHTNYYNMFEQEKVEGVDLDDLLKHKVEIIQSMKSRISKWWEKKDRWIIQKYWYHIYTTLCILKNKSLDFTEEQKENINILHDRNEETEELRIKIISNIIREIEVWQI